MSQSNVGPIKAFEAAADYSAKQFFIVAVSADGVATLATAATDKLVGTIMNEPKSGEMLSVQALGFARAIAGGSVSIGDFLTADGSGEAIATTTTGNQVIGMAIEAADDGDVFEYQIGIWKHY